LALSLLLMSRNCCRDAHRSVAAEARVIDLLWKRLHVAELLPKLASLRCCQGLRRCGAAKAQVAEFLWKRTSLNFGSACAADNEESVVVIDVADIACCCQTADDAMSPKLPMLYVVADTADIVDVVM
jgi:hypothetical protein